MKTRAVLWESHYKRNTVFLTNENSDKLNAMAGTEKGEKTRLINEALEIYFKVKEVMDREE